MSFQIDEAYLIEHLAKMVQINSSNPSLTPGSPGEMEVGQYVAGLMQEIGLEVHFHDLGDNRVNVIGVLPGSGNGRSLLLNAHIDTVGVEGMAEPFSGRLADGKLYGRGSQDMKGSMAAMLAATKALVDGGVELKGDLLITAVADEEYASIGMENLVKHYSADAAIVTEPTDMNICRAHRGFIWYEVETLGRAAHGSRFEEGIDANMRMGRFLAELDKLEQELRQRTPHPLTNVPSLHAALIQGGTEISTYADRCTLKIERRVNPEETEAQTRQELQAILDRLSDADPTFKATLKPLFVRTPFEIGEEAEIVKLVDAVTLERLGRQPTHFGATFWTDAAILADAGIETMLIGPTGEGLHSAEEWVDVQSVVDLAYILGETAVRYCN